MDSGNSGSLQSSSGAEEECDSRAVVHDSGFITTYHHQPHPPPPPYNHHYMFDQNQINNPLLFTLSSPQHQLLNLDSLPPFFPSSPHPAAEPITTTKTTPPDPDRAPGRNPKKRSRASRRAPTTVLTTDTSNFRAMVQEFTGIPAPPFPSSSNTFPQRLTTTSFDLFGRSMMMRSHTNNFDYNIPQLGIPPAAPNYPSFKQKRLPPSSSLLDSTDLLTTMQMQNTISSSSSYLNQKLTTQNGFGVNVIHGLHSTTLPDIVSTTTTTARNGDDQMASGKWNDGADHHGEPWVYSSD